MGLCLRLRVVAIKHQEPRDDETKIDPEDAILQNEIYLYYWYRKNQGSIFKFTDLMSSVLNIARLLKDKEALAELETIYRDVAGFKLPVTESMYFRNFGKTNTIFNRNTRRIWTAARFLEKPKVEKPFTYFDLIMALDNSRKQINFIFARLMLKHQIDTSSMLDRLSSKSTEAQGITL